MDPAGDEVRVRVDGEPPGRLIAALASSPVTMKDAAGIGTTVRITTVTALRLSGVDFRSLISPFRRGMAVMS